MTKQADAVKESAEQIAQVIEENSNAFLNVSKKVQVCMEQINYNYNNASKLENSDIESVAATSEENTAMILTINESITAQSESMMTLSDSINQIKQSSDQLAQAF